MRFKRTASVVACVAVIGLAVLSIGSVQQPPRQSSDPLLQEVQQLRATLDYYFRVSTQIGFTTQRANAVQMRISSLGWELADIRTQLARCSVEMAPYEDFVKVEDAKQPSGRMTEYYITPQYSDAKRQIGAHLELEQQLRTRESRLAGALANEQAKWNELSQRLDALQASIGAQRH
jgi:chromosome segregation ATPase